MEKTEELKPGERVLSWEQLNENEQRVVVQAHADALLARLPPMLEIFKLARPSIVFGPGNSYCRVHQSSAQIMKLLTETYL
jgi:hypothetical protein